MTINTPYCWQYTTVTPESENRAREVQEAMELIKKKIFESNMSRQDIRIVMWAIQHRERILTSK